jgi:putative transposase
MHTVSYHRHRFPAEVIQHAVWLYFRFPLSFRDVEDLLAQRGMDVSYETVRRWSVKFGVAYAGKLRKSHPPADRRWHLDEVFVSTNGRNMYLWRAVDCEGEVLDVLVQSRRNKRAALKLMRKLLKAQGVAPTAVVTDKLPSYGAALSDLGMKSKHITGGRSNNRAENSHLAVRLSLADEEGDGVVLGPVSARRFQACRHPRLADQRHVRAAQGPAADIAFRR